MRFKLVRNWSHGNQLHAVDSRRLHRRNAAAAKSTYPRACPPKTRCLSTPPDDYCCKRRNRSDPAWRFPNLTVAAVPAAFAAADRPCFRRLRSKIPACYGDFWCSAWNSGIPVFCTPATACDCSRRTFSRLCRNRFRRIWPPRALARSFHQPAGLCCASVSALSAAGSWGCDSDCWRCSRNCYSNWGSLGWPC